MQMPFRLSVVTSQAKGRDVHKVRNKIWPPSPISGGHFISGDVLAINCFFTVDG
jgi:hypothetical protein